MNHESFITQFVCKLLRTSNLLPTFTNYRQLDESRRLDNVFIHPDYVKLISSPFGSDYKKNLLITRVSSTFPWQFPFHWILFITREILFLLVKISIELNAKEDANQRVANWETFSLPRHYPRRIKIFISFNEFLIGFSLALQHTIFWWRIMERFSLFDKLLWIFVIFPSSLAFLLLFGHENNL